MVFQLIKYLLYHLVSSSMVHYFGGGMLSRLHVTCIQIDAASASL